MSALPFFVAAGLSGVGAWLNPLPQPGDAGYREVPKHHFRLMFENDVFFNHDRNYSHGTRFDYAQRMESSGNYWGVSLMQNIYTPATHTRGAVAGQHPYVGYAALGGAYMITGQNIGMTAEFQVGTTGKVSWARDAQHFIHDLGNMEQWDGWGEQMPTELTLQSTFQQDFRLPWLEKRYRGGWQTDGMAFTRQELGTIAMKYGAGITLRFGRNLPQRMRLVANQAGNFGVGTLTKSDYDPTRSSYFLLVGAYGEYVNHDLFVDGTVLHKFNSTVGHRPWQGKLFAGVGVTHKGIDYYLGGTVETSTFRQQSAGDAYGTFAMSWNW